MSFGIWQLLLVVLLVFVLFGAGKLPNMMGDVGRGIRNLRDGLKSEKKDDKDELDTSSEDDKK